VIKKTVTYTDFNENEQVEDLYFHLSKAELIALEASYEGGLSTLLPEIVKTGNTGKILEMFTSIITKSFGRRSEDGKHFIKDDELTKAFMGSPAYDALLMDIMTSPEGAAEFVTGIVPKDLMQHVNPANLPDGNSVSPVERPWAHRNPTPRELREMSREELLEVMQRQSASHE
jgi:hypothetical protein